MNIYEILETCPKNKTIVDNFIRAYSIINNDKYKNIVCSISGGSDSDIMLDICTKVDENKKINYVYFDTGLEYKATKDHLNYLENKYNINIIRYKAIKPIPLTSIKYGQPFLSKRVSEMMMRLQRHNFQWEDEPFEVLYERYPKCKSALKWWTNSNESIRLNIDYNRYLRDYIIQNPPTFNISNKCCQYAKKDLMHKIIKDNKYELSISGIRRSEGGIRAIAYKSCFDENGSICDNYRPLFWYTNDDKLVYENHYNIIHSKCYTQYGLERTGCAGCTFGKDFENELNVIEKYEPNLYKAVNNIFKDSYEYMRNYKKFVSKMKELNK